MTGKRRQEVLRAGQQYASEIERRFPGAATEVLLESIGGHEAWIRIELPPQLHDRHEEVMDATAELNDRFDDEGVPLIATVEEVEQVGAHG